MLPGDTFWQVLLELNLFHNENEIPSNQEALKKKEMICKAELSTEIINVIQSFTKTFVMAASFENWTWHSIHNQEKYLIMKQINLQQVLRI